jgi:hypothetical protein
MNRRWIDCAYVHTGSKKWFTITWGINNGCYAISLPFPSFLHCTETKMADPENPIVSSLTTPPSIGTVLTRYTILTNPRTIRGQTSHYTTVSTLALLDTRPECILISTAWCERAVGARGAFRMLQYGEVSREMWDAVDSSPKEGWIRVDKGRADSPGRPKFPSDLQGKFGRKGGVNGVR